MVGKINQTNEYGLYKSICHVGKETNQTKLFKVRIMVILNVWEDWDAERVDFQGPWEHYFFFFLMGASYMGAFKKSLCSSFIRCTLLNVCYTTIIFSQMKKCIDHSTEQLAIQTTYWMEQILTTKCYFIKTVLWISNFICLALKS